MKVSFYRSKWRAGINPSNVVEATLVQPKGLGKKFNHHLNPAILVFIRLLAVSTLT